MKVKSKSEMVTVTRKDETVLRKLHGILGKGGTVSL